MSYNSDKNPLGLTALTTLATNDTFIVGDTSDTDEVVKTITVADLLAYLQTLIETTFLVATGAVNSANTSFTFTQAPQAIIADGTTYFENNGYTLSGLTATMDIAPSQYIKGIK